MWASFFVLANQVLLESLAVFLHLFRLLLKHPLGVSAPPFVCEVWVYQDQVHPHFHDLQVLDFDSFHQLPFILFLPLLGLRKLLLFVLFGFELEFGLSLKLQELVLLVLESVLKHLGFLSFGHEFLGLCMVLGLGLKSFFDSLGVLLDIFDFLVVLLVDLLDDLERPVAFAVDFELLFAVVRCSFLLDLHAIVGSLCALDMEEYVTFRLVTLDAGTDSDAFLATDHTSFLEFGEVHSIHLHRSLGCDYRSWHPHAAAMMDPVVKSVSHWAIRALKPCFMTSDEVTVIAWGLVVVEFLLRKVDLKLILLDKNLLHRSVSWFRWRFASQQGLVVGVSYVIEFTTSLDNII